QLVEPFGRAFDHFDHVAVGPLGVPRVHAHAQHRVAPVGLVDGLHDLGARAGLLERRDRVFEVEEHHVGAEVGRLPEHLLAGTGHREARTAGQVAGAFRHGAKAYRRDVDLIEVARALGVSLEGTLPHGANTGAHAVRTADGVDAVLKIGVDAF